jgi:hypothetical protein
MLSWPTRQKVSYDANKPATFIRVIKDFTVDDPTTAEPATFSVTKERASRN